MPRVRAEAAATTLASVRPFAPPRAAHVYVLTRLPTLAEPRGEPVWIWAAGTRERGVLAIVSAKSGALQLVEPLPGRVLAILIPLAIKILVFLAGVKGLTKAAPLATSGPLVLAWLLGWVLLILLLIWILIEIKRARAAAAPGGAGGGAAAPIPAPGDRLDAAKQKAEQLRDILRERPNAIDDLADPDTEKAARAQEELNRIRAKLDGLTQPLREEIDESDLDDEDKRALKEALDKLREAAPRGLPE